MRARATSLFLMLTLVSLLCLEACSTSKNSPAAAKGSSAPILVSGTRTPTGKELAYGTSAGTIPGAVYQPDVVVIGGGASAIHSADSTGLDWTIDGSAPGASRLAVDKIMVATSFATGRVLALKKVGSDLLVTLGPVSLTDVFYTLHVSSSSAVALQSPMAYSYPGSPLGQPVDDGSVTTGSAEPSVAKSAGGSQLHIEPAFAPSVTPSGVSIALPGPTVTPKAVNQGEFSLTPICCSPEGVRIGYSTPTGRMAATVQINQGQPLLDFRIDIDFGGLQQAVFELHGPRSIEFQFDAATKNVSGNYKSPTLEIPLSYVFFLGSVPFTVTLTQSIFGSIQLAGQAAFSTTGEYTINGGLGFRYTRAGGLKYDKPTFSTQLSALKNAASLSVGINAVSLGYGITLSVGIGVPGFNAGPYFHIGAKLVIDKDGSPPQTSLTAGCADAAVYIAGNFGVGYRIPDVVTKIVNSFLSLLNAKPIQGTGGFNSPSYPLWNPGKSQLCLKRS
jgi:hypothetical protein